MSENMKQSNMTNKENLASVKKSIWGEISAASGIALLIMAAIVVGAIVLFVFLNRVPDKTYEIIDDAGIFTDDEYEELEEMAEELMEEKDINVVIATTRDNPYGTMDSDCKEYAADFYKDNCITSPLRDNSGICIYVDLTMDSPGNRYFYIYTYGNAYYSVSNDSCQGLFKDEKPLLNDGYYSEAIYNVC